MFIEIKKASSDANRFVYFPGMNNTPMKRVKITRCGYGKHSEVWAHPQTNIAMKTSETKDVASEFVKHKAIEDLIVASNGSEWRSKLQHRINVPKALQVIPSGHEDWTKMLGNMPDRFKEPMDAMVTERIEGLAYHERYEIFERFCLHHHPTVTASVCMDFGSLVRPFLGSRSQDIRLPLNVRLDEEMSYAARLKSYDLHCFALYLDYMVELKLPLDSYAMAMADAYAFLYWIAKVDAPCVEFTLSQPRRGGASVMNDVEYPGFGPVDFDKGLLNHHALWMLDFSTCQPLDLTPDTDLYPVAKSFWLALPYAPRPGKSVFDDHSLWLSFRARFVEMSCIMLASNSPEIRDIPNNLMATIEKTVGVWAT